MRIICFLFATLAFVQVSPGVGRAASQDGTTPPPQKIEQQGYTPGLGEFMTVIQMRHAKLWFAGKGRNWELAAYELDELKEAFEDVAQYQPEYEGKPIAAMIGPITSGPIAQIEKAIDAHDFNRFAKAYDGLSRACSACHQATEHGFIRIKRPTVPPVTNQRFDSGR